jgi:hypothetical protein
VDPAPIATGIFYGQAIPAHAVMIRAIVWAVLADMRRELMGSRQTAVTKEGHG